LYDYLPENIYNASMEGPLEVPNIHPEFILSTEPLVGLMTAREGCFFDIFYITDVCS